MVYGVLTPLPRSGTTPQDTDGIGVCCVFYGGDYDERTGECWIDHEAKLEEANPGPSVPPKQSVLTRVDRLPVYAMG